MLADRYLALLPETVSVERCEFLEFDGAWMRCPATAVALVEEDVEPGLTAKMHYCAEHAHGTPLQLFTGTEEDLDGSTVEFWLAPERAQAEVIHG